MHLKLKQTISEIFRREKYFNAFSTSGVIGNQTRPSRCFRSFFNTLLCKGYGGAGPAPKAPPTDRHRDAQFKFDLDVEVDATTSDFGAYNAPNALVLRDPRYLGYEADRSFKQLQRLLCARQG